jgi:hypothetical protein
MRGTSRVGTIKDSYYSIKNRIDMLEDEGKIKVKTLGESPDGKVTNEFHIYPNDRMSPFTIYDYKFGFDPSEEEHFMEDYPFSVGGKNQNALESAKALGFDVISNQTMESKEDEITEGKDDMLANWISDMLKYKSYDEVLRILKNHLNDAMEERSVGNKFDSFKAAMDNDELDETFVRQMKYKAGIIK